LQALFSISSNLGEVGLGPQDFAKFEKALCPSPTLLLSRIWNAADKFVMKKNLPHLPANRACHDDTK
jgi:hypothetical protein